MEKFRIILERQNHIVRAGIAGSMVLMAASCAVIDHNNDVKVCERPSSELTPATLDPYRSDYSHATDPEILVEELMAITQQEVQDRGITPGGIQRKQVGLGEVACTSLDGGWYLTPLGQEISRHVAAE